MGRKHKVNSTQALTHNPRRLGWFSKISREVGKSLLIACLPICIGVVAFWLSPLKSYFFKKLWPESAALVLKFDTEKPTVGDIVTAKLLIIPRSPSGLSSGMVTIVAPSENLRLMSESTVMTPKLSDPAAIPDTGFKFEVLKPGTVHVRCEFTSSEIPSAAAIANLEISEPGENAIPSTRNFSGKWKIFFGADSGVMQLRMVSASIIGRFELANGTKGSIDGLVDGTVFHAQFLKTGSPQRWVVKGNWAKYDQFIEIKGAVAAYSTDSEKWVESGDETTFWAAANVTQALPAN